MVRRTRTALVAVVGLVTFASACGSPPASTEDSQPPTPTTTTAPAPSGTESATKCTAPDLRGTVRPQDAAAGNRYAELVVTNTSAAACTLYGYGGLQFVDGNGKPTPTDLTREPDPGPRLVTLAPGETAAKKLHWGVVASGDEPVGGPCQPPSAGARVIPPDDTEAFAVTFDFGSVCAGGRVEGSAYFRN